MGRDIRGVSRGACSQSQCPCKDFRATNDGNSKCADCGHAPAQHVNLESPGQAVGKNLVTPKSLSSPSVPVAKPMVTVASSVCTFPGCQQLSLFDPNTGVESSFCSDHMHSNDVSQCSLPGCTRPRNFDHVNGVMYECCSRDHGKQYILQFHQPSPYSEVIPQNLKCKNPKCYRKRYPVGNGTFHDYCGKTCRDSVSQVAPGSSSGPLCALPGCYLVVQTGHPFCGKTHAQKAIANVLLEVHQTSPEYKQVLKKFQATWVKNPPPPNPDCVFKVWSPQLETQFKQYQANLTDQTIEDHFHGTTLTCDLLSTKQACKNKSCGICGISRHGFDLNKIGTNISRFKRFGLGFYLAPNSSKCHDYTQGVTTHRSMMLCEVLPGNKYTVKKDQTSLKSPPQGYDSVYGQTGGTLNYPEIVLYQPSGLLPKYVIVYQKDGVAKIAK